jgi:DNA repair protein RadC
MAYTIKQQRCKLVRDGGSVRAPVDRLRDPGDAAALFLAYYDRLALPHERMVIALVDSQGAIVGLVKVSEGGLHGAAVTPADILRPAIVAAASGIVLAHNHPSGNPTPSREDIEITKTLVAACRLCGLELYDHIIVGGGAHRSLAGMGYMGGIGSRIEL